MFEQILSSLDGLTDLERADECLGALGIQVAGVDAVEDGLALGLRCGLDDLRRLVPARSAPRAPDIDDDHLAGGVSRGELPARQVLARQNRCRGALLGSDPGVAAVPLRKTGLGVSPGRGRAGGQREHEPQASNPRWRRAARHRAALAAAAAFGSAAMTRSRAASS